MSRIRRQCGYTLVEVLLVVIVVGLASAIVVPQMLAPGTMGVQAAARMVMADLMYAQNEAVAQQQEHQVYFEPELNRYVLLDADDEPLEIQWRSNGGSQAEVDFNRDTRFSGVELVSADFGDESKVAFDEMGSPTSGGSVILKYNDDHYRVKVAAFTGRVTVERF